MICPQCGKRRLNRQAARIVAKGHCEACDTVIDLSGIDRRLVKALFGDD